MKKKFTIASTLLTLAMLLIPISVQAAWKTTSQGTIYTQKKSPGYYTGWHTISGAKYYFDPKTGVMATGFRTITVSKKNYTYYFGTDGKLATGFITVDGIRYYMNAKGRMQYGFLSLDGKVYYSDPANGSLARNIWIDGIYYFQNDYTMAVNTSINGKRVGADGKYNGAATPSGFVRKSGVTYYYDTRGNRVTGWVSVGGNSYYMRPAMATGVFTVGNYSYYAGVDGAIRKNTWYGKKYFKANGTMAVGWDTIGGTRYYFKSNGDYATGAKNIDGKRYRFTSEGALRTSFWLSSGGKKYYYGADGARVTGFATIGKRTYYFSSKGVMQTKFFTAADGALYYGHKSKGYLFQNKWFTKNGQKYYATANFKLATGVTQIGGKIYGFDKANGRMYKKTKVTIDGATYYFDKNGVAVTSKWKKISGKYYYFGATGKLVTNSVVDGYQVDANGVRGAKAAGGWQTINGTKHYVVAGKSVTGWQTISGNTYYFSSNGVMLTGIQEISGKKYYFYSTGILAKSLSIAISDKEYVINSKGVVTSEKTITVSGTTKGSQIAKFALKYVGNKYVYGGTSLTNGADCSGFVQTVFSNFGIKLLRVADDQMDGPNASYIAAGYKRAVVVSPGYLLPGDLVFYGSGNYASHVGIYIGNNKIVHASNSQPYPAGGIKISVYNYQTPIKYVRYWS